MSYYQDTIIIIIILFRAGLLSFPIVVYPYFYDRMVTFVIVIS